MSVPEKKKYKNNFLTQVICQITFAHNLEINDSTLAELKKDFGETYSELATIQQRGIFIENDGSELKTKTENGNMWQIRSNDETHFINITQQFVAITFTKYVKFSDYIVIVETFVHKFLSRFAGIDEFSRIGLRYVNQIKVDDLDDGWGKYLSKELTCSTNFVDSGKLRRSMNAMFIQHDEDTKLTYNFGVFNQYFPAPISENEFILDLDAFHDTGVSSEDFRSLVEKFNKVIAIYFEKSITEKLREKMEEIRDGEE